MNKITLGCGTTYTFDELEAAGISYVPCSYEKPLFRWGHFTDSEKQVTRQSYGRKWHGYKALHEMQGVQIFTGKPTHRTIDGHRAYLVDIDIEARMIDQYPVHTERIRQVYRDACDGTPCEIQTKSGGSRLSGFSPWYESKRAFQDKTVEGNDKPMLLEIFSLGTLSRIDDRYAMKEGSLLNIPIVPKSAYQEIHAIISEIGAEKQARSILDATIVETCQLDDLDVHFGEDGRSQYFSSQYCQRTSHSSDRPTVQFFKMDNGGILGRCYNCGESWWERPSKQRAKLQRSDNTQSVPTESLDENSDRRETATDTFLATESDDSLHIFIVKDATGTGKSHTILTKSKQHNKRTIMNPPHNELAAQAVETARDHGFENPFHLLGREHNWDESGIAEIPVAERTAELFDRNNCIMVDQIKTYTDKRLAPRTYCENKCPFREGCPHLAQYKGLGQRDFIASCTPGLLFDLNMRGYLQSLVTATDEPSDTDLAIDAKLGTESEATPEFDFAILDDYGISALYTDVSLSESDFKALKSAWKGTPTSKFAKLVLKAFEKKKPHKIVKALRTAFESTADHHEQIAKCLTQHARIGTIEYAEQSKHSKESERLLSEKVVKYTDGGLQFVPVDFAAYQELTEKDIPTIHPQHLETTIVGEQVCVPHAPVKALIAGVPVKDLTPVWQREATPINLILILLNNIKYDRNAPISRSFRAGDNPVAILTFSIPPQAPVGILPQIAMLSATSDINDTKRSFERQNVSFSEHAGGQLQLADRVQVYQYQDARLTSGSVFEYPTNDDGKRLLQEAPTGLTPTAAQRITKLNEWAKQIDGITAFISYKNIAESFTGSIDSFDIITHYDKVAGLNFDGLKFLVIFGYPKVKHDVVIEHARKQYGSDSTPLPKGTYDELTETAEYKEHGITITERRYKDPRLERIRLQLSTEKLEQAIGRARLPRWTDTTTLIYTNAPTSPTSRATLFSDAAFNLAATPSELPSATQQIADAEARGDVEAVMETTGVSRSTAERRTKAPREKKTTERDTRILALHSEGKSTREIESIMKNEGYDKVSRPTVNRVIKVSQNRQRQLDILIRDDANETPQENVGEPCLESIPSENSGNGHHPVPRTEYSKLTECEARAELEYCNDTHNYSGASLLRNIFKQRNWHIK